MCKHRLAKPTEVNVAITHAINVNIFTMLRWGVKIPHSRMTKICRESLVTYF